ncbi:hypothetical protein Dimus_038396 [Dionaea muscipula]
MELDLTAQINFQSNKTLNLTPPTVHLLPQPSVAAANHQATTTLPLPTTTLPLPLPTTKPCCRCHHHHREREMSEDGRDIDHLHHHRPPSALSSLGRASSPSSLDRASSAAASIEQQQP